MKLTRYCSRFARATCLIAALLLAVGVLSARAQNEANEAVEIDPPAAAQPQPAADGPPAAGDAAKDAAPAAPEESLLAFTYHSLGLRYTVSFLFISFTFVALTVMNLLAVRRENVVPIELVEAFDLHVKEGRFQEAYDLAKGNESFLGQVLAAGLGKVSLGYAQAIEAMQEVGEEENMKLDHRLSYLALIGTISPMVGLLGTVDGMVVAFRVIAASTTQPKPSQLAEGISMALVTTLIGLLIAIPAVAIYNILRNRVARLVLEVGILSEGLMSRFAESSQKKV